MGFIVAMISQKGGVGKSTLARLLASEFARLEWQVKIADLDTAQGTSYQWRSRRLQNQIEPDVPVEQFGSVERALAIAPQYDMLILDGAAHHDATSRALAAASDLVVIPTGLSLDDLGPAVILAHALVNARIPQEKIVFALCRTGGSVLEINEAVTYIFQAGYAVLSGSIPEKTAYRRASDEGRALTETRYESLNDRAEELAQGIVDKISELTPKKGVATNGQDQTPHQISQRIAARS